MTKSYSEQICKNCGIKPQKVINSCYDCPYCVVENDNDYECKLNETFIACGVYDRLYPNFESNDNGNFMKLFNLKYDNEDEDATIAGYIYSRYKNIVNTHWFLGFLLFELEHGKNADVEKIKKVIKETEWKI